MPGNRSNIVSPASILLIAGRSAEKQEKKGLDAKHLAGKRVLVTGAGTGIGQGIAREFAREGADVVFHYAHSGAGALAGAEEARELGVRAAAFGADFTVTSEVQRLAQQAIDFLGGIDILVNNAGITRDGLIFRMSLENWEKVLAINLTSAFLISQAVARLMIKQRSGSIINMASIAGVGGNAGQANYAASKAGLIGLTRSLAKETGGRGVRVNAVAPGYIDTEMTRSLPEAVRQAFVTQLAMARPGQPQEVARVVTFLASDMASYVSGTVLRVDGCMSI
jgi:3-oxoacyl-[acyl-carrier protein] reductase